MLRNIYGYRCPLCPDHKDDRFVESKIVGKPICEGCSEELSIFLEQETRPEDGVIDRLEEVTGMTFTECKKIWIEEAIEQYEHFLLPENIEKKHQWLRRSQE